MSLWQDIRFAVRLLVKNRWFTIVAATALALGIAVNTAVFTFVNAVLIRGLPFDDPDRIIAVGTTDTRNRQLGVSRLDFNDWRDSSKSFAALAIFLGSSMNVSDEGRAPEQFQGVYQSANLFQLIGVRPALGRDLRPEDDHPGAAPVALLGGGIWKNRYGSDPAVIGRTIKVNSVVVTVIGIMPPDFKFPFNTDIWIPLSVLPAEARDAKRGVRNFQAIGRLAPGVTLEQARAEFQNIGQRLSNDFPESNKDFKPQLVTFNERVTGPQITLIFLSLMGAVAFVLLIACANVANLLLSRAAHRSREIAVRVSLGAGRWRIIRQLLVESVLLSLFSGAIGLGLSIVGIRLFDAATTDVGKPYWMTFTLDPIVFGFLLLVCVGTGVLFGLAPAMHVSKTDVHEVLKEGGGRSGSGGMRARRWTGALIVVEIVLTLVLLAGAGFMMRSFLTLYTMEIGIDTSRLLTMQLALPLAKYPAAPSRERALYQQLEERLRRVSAIQNAGITTNMPTFGGFLRQLSVDGRPAPAGEKLPDVTMVSISPGYFDTLGVKLQRGRSFTDADGTPGHEAAIVNQRFVTMHFAGEDPLGRRIRLTDSSPQVQQPRPSGRDDRRDRSDRTPAQLPGSRSGSGGLPAVSRRSAAVHVAHRTWHRRSRAHHGARARRDACDRAGHAALPHPDDGSDAGAAALAVPNVWVDVRDVRRHCARLVGGRTVCGHGVLGDPANGGDWRPNGARGAAETGDVARDAPLADSTRGWRAARRRRRVRRRPPLEIAAGSDEHARSAHDRIDRPVDDRRLAGGLFLAGAAGDPARSGERPSVRVDDARDRSDHLPRAAQGHRRHQVGARLVLLHRRQDVRRRGSGAAALDCVQVHA